MSLLRDLIGGLYGDLMYEEEKLIERTISSEITDKWFATSHGSQWRERTTETASAFPQAASDIKTGAC